jgi:hypothetical protein
MGLGDEAARGTALTPRLLNLNGRTGVPCLAPGPADTSDDNRSACLCPRFWQQI